MQTVAYEDLLRGSALRAGLNPDDLSGGTDGDFANLRLLHSLRLGTAWIYQEWPFLCPPTERRFFRDAWDGAENYTAADEVLYLGPGKYFQALVASLNQAPATWDGTSWTTNLDYWAESALSYSAQEYSNAADYVQGDQVFYTPTQEYYQLFAATSTGNLPTDTTKWGLLTAFDPYVAFEQTGKTAFEHAFRAWDLNPNTHRRAVQLDCWMTDNGLQVPGPIRTFIYLDYRRRAPQLTGDLFDATETYAVGDQVYFRDEPSYRGNFYDCISATSAGQSPATHAAKWQLVELPLAFNRYAIHGAAADILRGGTEDEKALARTEEGMAASALEQQEILYFGQCATRLNTRYKTR